MADWESRIVGHGEESPDQILANPRNWRIHPQAQQRAMEGVLSEIGWVQQVIVNRTTGHLVDGHMRVQAALRAGAATVPVVYVELTADEESTILATFDPITALAVADAAQLEALLQETSTGDAALQQMLADLAAAEGIVDPDRPLDDGLPAPEPMPEPAERPSLADRFGVPPFSVLDARQGYWQERKRRWMAYGIQSELGRGEDAGDNGLLGISEQARGHYKPARTFGQDTVRAEGTEGTWMGDIPGPPTATMKARPAHGPTVTQAADGTLSYGPTNNGDGTQSGTSVFDPVLCEVAYRWFSPEGGTILDPFAGGSVRGIVASLLGREYIGIDLSGRQLAANEEQAALIVPNLRPRWIEGDSAAVLPTLDVQADLVFSCPPYADLEVYSDDPRDISNMPYEHFLSIYRDIIRHSIERLRDDRFACFVVGDVRDKRGLYRNFVGHTVAAFEDAGARFYNEAILVTTLGSLPIRVGRQFMAGRKLGKTHQNMLVFVKGDPRRATEACGNCEFGEVPTDEEVA